MESVIYGFDRKERSYGRRFWINGFKKTFEMQIATCGPSSDDEPLYLNKYIENGNIDEGRQAALVKPFLGDVKSYSGFFSVDKEKECHMFFWYFPTEYKCDKVPLLIWLNGWATPSTYGTLVQNGPFKLNETGLTEREVSWNKWYHVLYIDSPLGVGYSHGPESKFSTDLKSVSKNTYWTMHYFLQLFPELNSNDLYLTGLSMGGNYVVHLAKEIELANSINKNKIKLKGLFVGNPLVGGAHQFRYSKFLHQFGYIDINETFHCESLEDGIIQHALDENYNEAITKLRGFVFDSHSYIKDVTGLSDLYDLRQPDSKVYDTVMKLYMDFMKKENVRKELHVGRINFRSDTAPLLVLKHIIPKPSLIELQSVLNNYKCYFYCGQFDIICNYPSFSKTISKLEWPGSKQFNEAARKKLFYEGHVCGYWKVHGNLSEVMIRNAGHSAVEDQPHVVLNLLHSFVQFHPTDRAYNVENSSMR